MDYIDRVTHKLCNYGIPQSNDLLKEFSYLIVMSGTEILHAVDDLATLKKAEETEQHAREVNRLYNLSTELLSRSVIELSKQRTCFLLSS